MIRPTPRAIAVAATLVALCLLTEALVTPGEVSAVVGWVLLMGIVLANLVDIALALRLRIPPPTRVLPRRLIVGQFHSVPVTVINPYGFSLRLDFNERPARSGTRALHLQGLPRSLKMPARYRAGFEYRLQPLYRGTLALGECELQVSGPLGLWQVRRTLTLPQRAQVGPDAAALERLALQGSGPAQRSGYPGPLRLAPPLTLVVWLDTGPGLQSGAARGRLWGHATDATLALAFAALGTGRPIGLHLNSGVGSRQLLPSASERQLPELHRVLNAIQPSGQPVDFAAEAARLLGQPLGATFIMLITRLPAHTGDLQGPLRQLAQRHRLLIVDVLDESLVEARRKPVRTAADALGYCRAIQALSAHEQAAYPLTSTGLNVAQTPGNTLATLVVEQYAQALR